MSYPTLSDYQSTIQHPQIAFLDPDLRKARVETRPNGMPWPRTGGFAVTYKLESPVRTWAVRCFHRNTPDIELRYQGISRFLAKDPPPRFVDFSYLPSQILVQGQRYPVVKMDWIEGVSLETHVGKNRSNPRVLKRTADEIRDTIRFLETNNASHGDLQHGNILVSNSGVRFIDYDGMYVSGMPSITSIQEGHVNYQSPLRTGNDFGPELDRFSGIVICLTLEALQSDPSLWDRYNVGDNLIFQRKDFIDPSNSDLFKELSSRAEFQQRAERLATLCTVPLSQLPTVDQFFQGSFTVSSLPKTSSPGITHARLHQYDIISARERQELLGRVGDVVQVVGKVVNVSTNYSRTGQPYAFIDFGPWRYKHFRLTVWSSTLARFREDKIDITSWEGRWVTVTGMIEEWNSTPQIIIDEPQEIREIIGGEEQAKRLLKESNQQVTVAARQAAKPATRNLEILERIRETGASSNSSGSAPAPSAGSSNAPMASSPAPGTTSSRNKEALERIRRQQAGSTSVTQAKPGSSAVSSSSPPQIAPTAPSVSKTIAIAPTVRSPANTQSSPKTAVQPTNKPRLSNRVVIIGIIVIVVVAYFLGN